MKVRTLRSDERIPEGLQTGFDKMPVQNDWVWIAEENEEVLGVLIAAPCHGLVYLMRFCAVNDAPLNIGVVILRACMRTVLARGYKGFFMHIDPTREAERRMIPIVRRAKGCQLLQPIVTLTGSVEHAARY